MSPVGLAFASTTGAGLQPLTFVANRAHSLYEAPLSHAVVVERIATAHGELGSNREYLLETLAGLAAFGIKDRCLAGLARDVEIYLCAVRTLAVPTGRIAAKHS